MVAPGGMAESLQSIPPARAMRFLQDTGSWRTGSCLTRSSLVRRSDRPPDFRQRRVTGRLAHLAGLCTQAAMFVRFTVTRTLLGTDSASECAQLERGAQDWRIG